MCSNRGLQQSIPKGYICRRLTNTYSTYKYMEKSYGLMPSEVLCYSRTSTHKHKYTLVLARENLLLPIVNVTLPHAVI